MSTIMKSESGQIIRNTFSINILYQEATMPESDFDKIEIQKKDMKISLLFPMKTEKEAAIKKDIKAILSGALQEQMQRKIH